MARPTKNNAEYFSHDADMRNDVKVKALRRKFSNTGYAVWCFILETLTDTDFFEMPFDDVSKELLAADFDITVEELETIVDYCLKINLLQMTPEQNIISEAHQKRFAGLLAKRKRDRERISRFINKKNAISTAKTAEHDSYRSENPHSKVKESKVKESKVKESKVKKIYPYQGVADLWNEICFSLPRLKSLSEDRKKKIKTRLDEFNVQPEQYLSTAKDLFERVQASDFLTGRQSNKTGWVASFDWLFSNSSNWVKVQEGNYDNNRGANVQQNVKLGTGEFIDANGNRTYGSGRAVIPFDAPPRPSERYAWDDKSKNWILL